MILFYTNDIAEEHTLRMWARWRLYWGFRNFSNMDWYWLCIYLAEDDL